jgi:DNA-binding CsgD family transcriptional regulator
MLEPGSHAAVSHAFSVDPIFGTSRLLGRLIASVSRSRSQAELATLALGHIGGLFHAPSCAMLLTDPSGKASEIALAGIGNQDFDLYEKDWRHQDPVLAAVLERHVPVHSAQIAPDDVRKRSKMYIDYGKARGLFHYLAAPLYGAAGRLIGVVNMFRPEHHRPFEQADLLLATALSGHLSTNLARLPVRCLSDGATITVQLTQREREVASLVAQGSNNQEIASALSVARETVKKTLRRVYSKLDVNGRAQMVARLAEMGWF